MIKKNSLKITCLTIPFAALLFINFPFLSLSSAQNLNYEIVHYSEGKKSHTLKLLHEEIAEINGDNDGQERGKGINDDKAELISEKKNIRLWKVTVDWHRAYFSKGRQAGDIKGTYSPVFIDPSGRKRVLPGNIIVFMKKGMNEGDVITWAGAKGLKIIKIVSRYSNSYVLSTPPGIESLNMSNELNNDESVVASTPDWWTEVFHR